jgi:TRAP-type C4-dicarboxylate transport system permease small subunit
VISTHASGRWPIKALEALYHWLGFAAAFLAGAILAVMTVLVFLTVIYRYFLLAPISWGEELSRFLFISVSMLGAAIAVKDRTHFTITLLSKRFPPLLRPYLELAIALATTILFCIVIREGWGLVLLNRNQESPALGVRMSVPYMAVPVGTMLMLIFLWLDLIINWGGAGASQKTTEETVPRTD